MVFKITLQKRGEDFNAQKPINIFQNENFNENYKLDDIIKIIKNGKYVDEETIWKRSGLGFYEVVGFHILINLGKDVKRIIRKLGKEYQEDLPIFYDIDKFNVPLSFIVDINKNIIPNGLAYGTIIYNDIGKILNKLLTYSNYNIIEFSNILKDILGKNNFAILKSDNAPLWKYITPNPIADCPFLTECITKLEDMEAG